MTTFASLVVALTGGLSLTAALVAAGLLRELVIQPIGRIAHSGARRAVATFAGFALVALLAWIFLAPGILLRAEAEANAMLVLPWIAAIPLLTIGMFLAQGIGRVAIVAVLVIVSGGFAAAVGSVFEQAENVPHSVTPTIAFVIVISAVAATIWWANIDPSRSNYARRPQAFSLAAPGHQTPSSRSRLFNH
ncbi:hypothetical protein G3T36_10850 [Diaminobutyricibacter tongyongensis]|uniref:Uncharacterized protein n=1 Tax=Leifsonia tongyongensis TaxID=1268043 RepID=A0A6L9XY71_9MICO|nr:hypothetical protein [Diaminobutyricibacter tongyongensis]NEN06371.1 hypothetical protein [Diaminobutyricibacter tongyongensis]